MPKATASRAYATLLERERKRELIESIEHLLGWDEMTYMPARAAEARGEQRALMMGESHSLLASPETGSLLQDAEASVKNDTDPDVKANLRAIRRDYDRATKLSPELVKATALAASQGQSAWLNARQSNRFEDFRPALERIVALQREEAEALAAPGADLYDGLLQKYEPGITTAKVSSFFDELRPELLSLYGKIQKSKLRPGKILSEEYSVAAQETFARKVVQAMGFDFSRGRLDVTTHPFCSTMGPNDIRITTRYNPKLFNSAFFAMVHEAGHGLYEQGLPVEAYGTPLGRAASFGIHESQSRLWENFVARSPAFWEHFYPVAQELFPERLANFPQSEFVLAINSVSASFIRVEADEVTYNLHILLRFELEKLLISGELAVRDLPEVWNEKFKAWFGIVPSDLKEGVLQDMHWANGLFGYFPTYTLGNLNAAQFGESAEKEIGPLDPLFRQGDLLPLKEWLRERIHRHGQRYTASELCEVVTGKPLSPQALIRGLNRKYSKLYAF